MGCYIAGKTYIRRRRKNKKQQRPISVCLMVSKESKVIISVINQNSEPKYKITKLLNIMKVNIKSYLEMLESLFLRGSAHTNIAGTYNLGKWLYQIYFGTQFKLSKI